MYIYIYIYIFIYIYIHPSCEQDRAVVAEMFDNVKRSIQKQKSSPYPPLRRSYRESDRANGVSKLQDLEKYRFLYCLEARSPTKGDEEGAKTSKETSIQISFGQSFNKYVFYAFAYFPQD